MKFILRNSFGIKHCDVLPSQQGGVFAQDDLVFAKRVYWNLKSIAGHSLIHPTAYLHGDIAYFTILRDPVMRCASQYQRAMLTRRPNAQKPSFQRFITNEKNRNLQVKRIAGSIDPDKAIRELEKHYFFVGLTERFQESLRVFQRLCPLNVDIRYGSPLRQAPDNTIKESLLSNPVSYNLLLEANSADQVLYEYVRDVLYPAQLINAGLDDTSINSDPQPSYHSSFRFKLSRTYNNLMYRPIVKLRRRLLEETRPDQ